MVEAARIAYRDFPTVVNEVPESSISYDNNMSEYAKMDSNMQSAQKAIGGASDTAQLSQSYYWNKVAKGEFDNDCQQYYENTVILAVAAQLAIDGCKKMYSVNVNDDILRIRSQPCMKRKKDYPKFMQWTHDIPVTKNGKERPYEDIKKDKNKVKRRIDKDIICPMNWLEDCLDKIQGAEKTNFVDTAKFFIKITGRADSRHMSKIRKIIEEYDGYTKRLLLLVKDNPDYDDYYNLLMMKTDEVYQKMIGIRPSKITVNKLIGTVLGVDWGVKNEFKYKEASKYTRKTMNVLYRFDQKSFLENFKMCARDFSQN